MAREQAQRFAQGVVRVGVVDEHGGGLTGLDAFHAAGDTGETLQAGGDHLRIAAKRITGGEGRQQVADVAATDERALEFDHATRPYQAQGGAEEIRANVLGPDHGVGGLAKGDDLDRRRQLGGQAATVFVIEVDGGRARRSAGIPTEQTGLHGSVVRQRSASRGKVGEDSHTQLQAGQAERGEFLRAGLKHGLAAAGIAHLGEQAEQVE